MIISNDFLRLRFFFTFKEIWVPCSIVQVPAVFSSDGKIFAEFYYILSIHNIHLPSVYDCSFRINENAN